MKLSNEIAEGVYQGINRILKQLIWGFLVVIGVWIIGFIIFSFIPNQTQLEQATQYETCNYPHVTCQVYESKIMDCENSSCHYIGYTKEQLCGYQEANAWFEQIKMSNPNTTLEMECE